MPRGAGTPKPGTASPRRWRCSRLTQRRCMAPRRRCKSWGASRRPSRPAAGFCSLAPSDFEALFLTGNVLYDMRNLQDALAVFDKALAKIQSISASSATEARRFANWDASTAQPLCSMRRLKRTRPASRLCSAGASSSSKVRGPRRRAPFSNALSPSTPLRRRRGAGAAWRCSILATSSKRETISSTRWL